MSPRLERHAAAMRRRAKMPSPYERGLADGKKGYNRPTRYIRAEDLVEWFRGWQDGRQKVELRRKAPVSAIEPWQARRRAYLRDKAAALAENAEEAVS